jgi:hypothetical protein
MVEITPQELRRLRLGNMDRGEFKMILNRKPGFAPTAEELAARKATLLGEAAHEASHQKRSRSAKPLI